MPCITCNQNIEELVAVKDEWLTREQVRQICEPCYQSMVTNNFTKIKKSVMLDKVLNTTMKIIEIVFIGNENQIFNMGGHQLKPYTPAYYFENYPFH